MSFGFTRVERIGISIAAAATLAVAFMFAVSATSAKAAEPAQVRLFGSVENANFNTGAFPKWTSMLRRYAGERALEDQPCSGDCPLQRWKAFLTGLAGQDRMRQLDAVNSYVNRTPYQPDSRRFGVTDHWATPREFLGRSGDCEDYAIAKYLSLRRLGWQAHELRVLVLKDEVRNELHAVLIAYHGGTAYVLDNLNAVVVEHAAITRYRPIFSINEIAWHFHRDWNPGFARATARPRTPAAIPPASSAPTPGSPVTAAPPPASAVQAAAIPAAAPAVGAPPALAPVAAAAAVLDPVAAAPAHMAPESLAGIFTGMFAAIAPAR